MHQSTLDRVIVFADNEHEIEMLPFSLEESLSDHMRWTLKVAA